MFRLWAKTVKNNKIINDLTISDPSDLNRTKKIFHAIDTICHEFDLSTPLWLDSNINEFKRLSKTRFTPDNFIDSVDFDFLDISVIEED